MLTWTNILYTCGNFLFDIDPLVTLSEVQTPLHPTDETASRLGIRRSFNSDTGNPEMMGPSVMISASVNVLPAPYAFWDKHIFILYKYQLESIF